MREITLEELLEAGCHFGHQVTRQNPKAREFVFEARDNIHIIDLAKTKQGLEEAGGFIRNLASQEDSSLLLVGTKRQAQIVVEAQIQKIKDAGFTDGFFYVKNRWIGGILTNLAEVSKNYAKLKDITEKLGNPEEKAKYTKKEVWGWEKEKQKLESFYAGVADMKKVPSALFIIDSHLEDLAVKEANNMHVKTVGIVDTNADPEVINYPIPANDDAVGSLELIIGYIIDAWIEGRNNMKTKAEKAEADKKKAEEKVKEDLEKPKKEVKKKTEAKPKVEKKVKAKPKK